MYDLDYRYRRALSARDCHSPQHIAGAIHDALEDARLAGIAPASDPAVALLFARQNDIVHGTATDTTFLVAACERRLASLEQNPSIIAIVRSGASQQGRGILDFRREARMSLRQIGRALGIDSPDQFISVRSKPGQPDEVVFDAPDVRIEIYGYQWHADHAIAYQAKRTPYAPRATAPIEAIADLDGLIATIRDFVAGFTTTPMIANA